MTTRFNGDDEFLLSVSVHGVLLRYKALRVLGYEYTE
jgi:hypothetical protein